MTQRPIPDIPAAPGMAALVRTKDWSKTALGAAEDWSPNLTMVVNIVFASGFPMAVRWGPDFIMIYNDGYRPILGDKHPWALGLPFREVWPEVQPQLGPLHEAILSGKRSAIFAEDLLLKIQRHAVETTNRVLTEAALRGSEERYRSAMMLGRMGSWEVDFVKGVRNWTPEGMALFGLDLPDALGHVGGEADELLQALHPEDRHQLAQFHAIAGREDSFPAEYRIVKPDGEIRWLSGYGRVLERQSDGKASRLTNVATDVTDRKATEAHQRFLLQELSHRSKNLLSIVQAIADQTLRNCSDLKEFQDRFDGRLRGLAASNTLLALGDWRGSSLRALIELQLAPFIDLKSPQIEIEGPKVDLTAEAAQAIGLSLHELATNAVKHGALSVPAGRLSITWQTAAARDMDGLNLDWRERSGPPVAAARRTGFGHVVMKRMIEQAVKGTVELNFAPDGLQWSLQAPATVFLR
jgi:two-component sensor histidine kinase